MFKRTKKINYRMVTTRVELATYLRLDPLRIKDLFILLWRY